MAQKKDLPKERKASKEKRVENQPPQEKLFLTQNGRRPILPLTPKILLWLLVISSFLFLTIAFVWRGTPKPFLLKQNTSTEKMEAPSIEERVGSQTSEKEIYLTLSPALPAFFLLRQDILAGLPPYASVEHFKASISNLPLPSMTSELDFLAQKRTLSFTELMMRFEPATFFHSPKKKGILCQSIHFLTRLFTIKKTSQETKKPPQEGLKEDFCTYVKEGDLAQVFSLEKEIEPFLTKTAYAWLEEAHRFKRAQEILSLIEKNILDQ
jgi:hypothetical protein